MSAEYKIFVATERVKQRKLHPLYSGKTITAIVNEEWNIYKNKSQSASPPPSFVKKKNEYRTFIAEEKERLRKLYPDTTKGERQKMANATWNLTKGSGAYISGRFVTMTNALNNTLIARVPQFDLSQYDEIQSMLIRKKCIYCDAGLRKKYTKGVGDHIFPVQDKSTKLPILHNFSAFTVPCCVSCNTIRRNTPLKEFLMSDIKYQTNLAWFQMLEPIINQNIKYYDVDVTRFNTIVEGLYYDLERTRQLAQDLPIMERAVAP